MKIHNLSHSIQLRPYYPKKGVSLIGMDCTSDFNMDFGMCTRQVKYIAISQDGTGWRGHATCDNPEHMQGVLNASRGIYKQIKESKTLNEDSVQ